MHKLLSAREKMILLLTFAVFVFSLALNFFILPVYRKSDALNKDIKRTRAKLDKYRQLYSQKEELQKLFGELFPAFKASGGDADAVESALFDLENLAKEANIRIVNIRPSTPKSSGLFQETVIDLRTEGALPGYLKFIYNTENSPSLLKIKSLELSSQPNSEVLDGSFEISQLSGS